jgi:magnesium-protoporphyrin O-methyltransferase
MPDSDKSQKIRSYFEGAGFESMRLVYSDEACDGFRLAMRRGHNQVVETVLSWLASPAGTEVQTVLDAGCGTGSLAVPLALAGARVDAIDFSENMIAAAEQRSRRAEIPPGRLKFSIGDLASVGGGYDAVVCIDVFARYSTEASVAMLQQLAERARSRLIFTFTPKKALDPLWLAIGGLVASLRKAPPLHTHPSGVIAGSLGALGWKIHRQEQISSGGKSYFCCLVEARRE